MACKKFFWVFVLGYAAFWTLLPFFMQPSPGLYDVTEAFVLAREWVMGSTKHPALPFWALECVYQTVGNAHLAVYLTSQLWVILGLWAVWKLARRYVSEEMALVVLLASVGYRYFHLGSIAYTTSVPPVSLWCLAIYFLDAALRENRKRSWILTGVTLGAGLLCKYSFGILFVSMLAYLTLSPEARKYWKTLGPWLTMVIAAMVFLPHFFWVVQNDFPTIRYAEQSLTVGGKPIDHVVGPVVFLLSQFVLFFPVLIALGPLKPKKGDAVLSLKTTPFPRFLDFMIFVPVVLQLLIFAGMGGHPRPAYGSPLWTLLALWMVVRLPMRDSEKARRRSVTVSFLIMAAVAGIYVGNYALRYSFTSKPATIHFPGKELARRTETAWKNVSDAPIPYLTGDWKLAGEAVMNLPSRPSVILYYYGMEPGKNPVGLWATDDDFNRAGGVILWGIPNGAGDDFVPEYVPQRYPAAEISPEVWEIPWATQAKLQPLRVGHAILKGDFNSIP